MVEHNQLDRIRQGSAATGLMRKPSHGQGAQKLTILDGILFKEGDGAIEPPAADLFTQFVVFANPDVDMHVWMFLGKGSQGGRQDIFEKVLWQAQANDGRAHCRTDRESRLIVEGDDPPGVGDQRLPGFGRYETSALSSKKLRTCLLFQLLQLHTYRRLRTAQLHRRTREAPEIGARHNGS